ncbi:MAG TPA: phospholipase D-like domain-containing protein [Usitatibacter sp.]|nr:phospholipase D-like domain-containing protein [Usitatibacter sp.]
MTGRLAAAAAAFLLAACASVPPIDRFLLTQEREPVRVEGSRGPLTHAQSEQVLADLKKRAPETSVLDRHLAVEEALTKTQLSVGNRATTLEDGRATYAAMLAAIKAARQHVHMEMYIFEDDEVGREFASAMAERVRAGVRVRLIYDAVGSLATPKEFFKELTDAGIQVVEFSPVKGTIPDLMRIQNRDHRKLVIVDGRVAFLGGINISGVYGTARPGSGGGSYGGSASRSGASGDDRDPPFEQRPWRDLQVRLEGPVVGDLQRAFAQQWERGKKEPLQEASLYPKLDPAGPHVVRAIATSPEDGNNAAYVALISAIEAAETEVLIVNAYFVPHPQLLESLKAAARRGVSVRLMLPSRSDNAVVHHAGRSYYEELLGAGVRIHERKSRLLHSKSAVVDGVWSTVGSTNLDWRSLAYNYELNAVILGTDFADRMKAVFARDLADSEEITAEKWAARPLKDRFKEVAARAWAQLL